MEAQFYSRPGSMPGRAPQHSYRRQFTYPTKGSAFDLFGIPEEPMSLDEVLDWFGPRPVVYVAVPLDEVLDWFGPRTAPPTPEKPKPESLTVAPAAELPGSPTLGIDLNKRGHEVRKLLFAGFGARIARSGYDPEDVLQEVYRGILARNVGKCPFDVRKSSFGHYVHMVCECILNNYHRRETRRREVEQVGMPAPMSMREDDDCGTVDAAKVAERVLVNWKHPSEGGDDTMGDAIRRLERHLTKKSATGLTVDPLAMQVAALLATGLNRREIAAEVGVSPNRVNLVIANLRERVADWL